MCLILFAFQAQAELPLVVAANRDEHFARPTQLAQFWQDSPNILAGRDLEAGGTWLGTSRDGRFAAITNLRGATNPIGDLSRGQLPAVFLNSTQSSLSFAEHISATAHRYSGFNLLLFDGKELVYCNNHLQSEHNSPSILTPGIYGLSNGGLNDAWPKIETGKQGLHQWLANSEQNPEPLLDLLRNEEAYPDHLLPDTGVSSELERQLSPLFISASHHGYGTCNSTAVIMRKDHTTFCERSFYRPPLQQNPVDQHFTFKR